MNEMNSIKQIDTVTADFVKFFGNLSEDQLNWKPNGNTWSVGQNIHHLMVINRTYFPIFNQVTNGGYSTSWFGKFSFITNFFGKLILQSVQPDRRRKMKTFPMWEPSASTIDSTILEQFKAQQEELKTYILEFADRPHTVIASPANKNIVYTIETAFAIIITHEMRHLEQAREVLASMK